MSKSHIYKLKVFVEDVDFGRVFYSRYLQYIERARTELINEKFGLTLTQLMNEHDIMFVVTQGIDCGPQNIPSSHEPSSSGSSIASF